MLRLKYPLIACFFLVLVTAAWSALGIMSVQLKIGQLRSTPSFLGAVTAEVAYGDQVDVLQQQGDWLEVRSSRNQTGWIHQSAVTRKRVVLGTGGNSPQTAASGEEIALAGKGFNADVEAEFRRGHRNMDFTWVDRMEEFKISTKEMISFLKAGGVQPLEGGGR